MDKGGEKERKNKTREGGRNEEKIKKIGRESIEG